jgi:3-hydroxybutyryl-CoA dehydratase
VRGRTPALNVATMPTRDSSDDGSRTERRRLVIERGLHAGMTTRLVRTFTQEDIAAFARITGDRNPYHFDDAFASQSRFGEPIAHGLLVASMITEVGGELAWLATSMTFRFVAPVHAGDTITLEMTVLSISEKNFAEAQAIWTNQHGKIVLTGDLAGYPPTHEQRKLLER